MLSSKSLAVAACMAACATSVDGFRVPTGNLLRGGLAGVDAAIMTSRSEFAGRAGQALVEQTCRARLGAMGIKATAAPSINQPYKIVDNAAKCAFLANTWKTQAEGARALGWTSSSEEEMIKLQKISYTADALAKTMSIMMGKAAADKAIAENPAAAENLPESIMKLNVVAAVSAGDGSACGLYRREEEGYITIERLFSNTQLTGQDRAQRRVVEYIIESAKTAGVTEVRLLASCTPTLYAEPSTMGFGPEEEGGYFSYKV